ncbi:MAG: NADH-quinone oxidoreductase subunit C [Bryobacteraceae bacterium]|nr:NADH-quinone oxidoreductase subunit C [Bryobacteraceae bacterium]
MNPKPPAAMQTTPWESELTSRLTERYGQAISEFSAYLGQNFLIAEPDAVPDLLEFLRDEEEFDMLTDLTAVHFPKREEQFEIVYILYSFSQNVRLRVKTRIKEGQKPQTVVPVHPTANWMEREVYDMFGIEFAGHPDLRRILMPDDWTGHPMRRDSALSNMDERWVQENLGIESGH